MKAGIGSGKGGSLRKTLLTGLGLAFVVCAAMVAVVIYRDIPSGGEKGPGGLGSVFGEMDSAKAALVPLAPRDAFGMLKRLLASRDEREVAGLILPGAISAVEAVEYLVNFPPVAEIHEVGKLKSSEVPALALIAVPVRGPLGVAFFRTDGEGAWKIDFDAFARHSEVGIGDFIGGAADAGTFRVMAATDTYYNGAYADDERWSCYCLTSPDHDAVVYAYCRRDSPQGEAMYALEDLALRRGQDEGTQLAPGDAASFRVTLDLKRMPGSIGRQVEIVSVVAADWMVTDSNFDETFKLSSE